MAGASGWLMESHLAIRKRIALCLGAGSHETVGHLGLEKLSKSTVHILRSILPRGPHRATRVGFCGVVAEQLECGIAHEAGH